MAFEVFKMGKLGDHLESEAYGWVAHQIKETYNIDPGENEYGYENDIVDVMTEEQVKEIEEYLDNTYKDKAWIEPYANTALNSICDRWRDENDVPWEPIEEEPKKGDIDVGEIMPDGYPKTFEVES